MSRARTRARCRRAVASSTIALTAVSLIGLMGALVGAKGVGAASTRAASRAPSVTLSLESPAIHPGQVTELVAAVKPATAGRAVILRVLRHGRYVNLATGTTNRLGTMTFRRAFSTTGSFRLRVTALATSTFPSTTSTSVVEDVAQLLPLTLAPGQTLSPGESGSSILLLQEHLSQLGYWLGTPDGYFGDATEQAVYALEKAAQLPRNDDVDEQDATALNDGALPTPRTTKGDAIDVDLADDLVMFVKNGSLEYVLNTSTGGGYTYTEDGTTQVATTPTGVYSIERVVNGTVTDSLGTLWRPRFFYEGYAIHGDSFVPPYPASHGCVRVSNEAIDWIWSANLAPIGMTVWIY